MQTASIIRVHENVYRPFKTVNLFNTIVYWFVV